MPKTAGQRNYEAYQKHLAKIPNWKAILLQEKSAWEAGATASSTSSEADPEPNPPDTDGDKEH